MPHTSRSTFVRSLRAAAAGLPMILSAACPGSAAAEQRRDEGSAVQRPDVQISSIHDATVLRNPGKDSAQILWPENAPDAQVTITRVTMQPGAVSERHSHPRSEQVWIIERGSGTLLLGDGKTREVKEGDLVRTPPGATHGIENTGKDILVYFTTTTPPENMTGFYSSRSGPK